MCQSTSKLPVDAAFQVKNAANPLVKTLTSVTSEYLLQCLLQFYRIIVDNHSDAGQEQQQFIQMINGKEMFMESEVLV